MSDNIKVIPYNDININKHHKTNVHNKKTNTNNSILKLRIDAVKWKFNKEVYDHKYQLNIIKNIISNNYAFSDEITKVSLQQINKKIYGYKHQDIIKNKLNKEQFITLETILNSMNECELKCYYCKEEMNVMYDISRESKQWTVDRIDNEFGHNIDNFYLACLDCNLKRRCKNDEKFLFTKQLKIVKVDNTS